MSLSQQITDIILEVKPGINLETSTDFIEDGIIDSFDVITIISELNDVFDIEIGMLDLVPENFVSIETIEELVKRLSE